MSVDLEAISEVFREGLLESLPRLRQLAYKFTRSKEKAEELMQATILRALEFEATFDPASDQQSWLFQIMRNLWLGRNRRRREVEDPDDVLQAQLTTFLNPERELLAKDLCTFLVLLPREQLDCLVLTAQGFDQQEIAETLGVNVGTVKSRVSRARQLLLRLMGEPQVPI